MVLVSDLRIVPCNVPQFQILPDLVRKYVLVIVHETDTSSSSSSTQGGRDDDGDVDERSYDTTPVDVVVGYPAPICEK
jgi:hypothetical protein